MKVSLRHSLATFVLVAISATAANAVSPGLEKAVAAARQEATRKAAARNWDGAVEAIRNARDRVRSERRTALRPQSPAETPAYRAAKKNLHEWLLQQQKLVKAGKTDRQRVGREFKQKELALQKKYGLGALPPHDSTAAGRATAAYDLLTAALEDTLADVYDKKGEEEAEATHRRAALVGRLHVYQAEGKTTQATQAVEKLLAVMADDPESYVVAGDHFQARAQYPRAVQVWEKGIREVESGRAKPRGRAVRYGRERLRNRYLAQFNRQLGFCYTKTGRPAEGRKAMERAAKLEAVPVPAGR